MYSVFFRTFWICVFIFVSNVHGAYVNVTNDYHNLHVAYNSTNNIPSTNGREGILSSMNEGGDVKLLELGKAKTVIDDQQINIVDPFEEFDLTKKNDQKPSVYSRKMPLNETSSLDALLNMTKHQSNTSLSIAKHDNMSQVISTQKPHKPLVTSIVSDNQLIIPALPPLPKENIIINQPQKNEQLSSKVSQNNSPPQQAVHNETVQKQSNLSESQTSQLIDEPVSEKSSNFKKFIDPLSKAHPNYIVPIVITIFAVPIFGIFGLTAVRRGREAWKNRHYRRMDFLIDGMYND